MPNKNRRQGTTFLSNFRHFCRQFHIFRSNNSDKVLFEHLFAGAGGIYSVSIKCKKNWHPVVFSKKILLLYLNFNAKILWLRFQCFMDW
jgi:hypothetical protein